MIYTKQFFKPGQTLKAEHLNHIEDGIFELSKTAKSGGSAVTIGEVELLAAKWIGTGSPYSQVVSIAGVTNRSQVDLKPTIDQLAIFHDKDLAFVTENDNGVVTVYALGDKPTNDYTIQVSITEVSV